MIDKDLGLIIFIYIFFMCILIFYNFKKQAFMITLMVSFYIYFNYYYSSIPEFIINLKKIIRLIIKNPNEISDKYLNTKNTNDNKISEEYLNKYNNINNDNNDLIGKEYNESGIYIEEIEKEFKEIDNNKNINKEDEYNIIKIIPSCYKLNILKEKIYKFIKNNVPNYTKEYLQIKQLNNKKKFITKIKYHLNKQFYILKIIINNNLEELNYYQQIKKSQKEILLLIHNTIYINHNSINNVEKLIEYIKNIFNEINNDIATYVNNRQPHKYKDFIMTKNEFTPYNNYNEDNILF